MVETKRSNPLQIDKMIRLQFARANEHRDYSIYTASMDAALIAKAQSLLPHFGNVPDGAVIVDAGSGTGALAEVAAREFRGAHVYALDVSHELMERATDGRALAKLVFNDAAVKNFPDNSIDIKYFSTSGHEIESFGGQGRMIDAATATYKELKPGGKIVIRDFAKPEGAAPIYMRILSQTGLDDVARATNEGILDYNLLSTNALFLQFHKEFRGGGAFDFARVAVDGKEYIQLAPEWAHEFYLRKDYTANWRQEIHEKYTYWSTDEAKQILQDTGYTDIQAIPDQNAYIVDNRLKGKIALFEKDEKGELVEIPFPPTHMVVVGTKPNHAVHVTDNPLQDTTVAVDYQELKRTISHDKERSVVTIDKQEFSVDPTHPCVQGEKKTVYRLATDPPTVLKVVRTDGLNDHSAFKAIYQSVAREDILDEYHVPHPRILDADPLGPPYRYFVQELAPENSVSAADLIQMPNGLTEDDVKQMAAHIDAFELNKKWQLDTNPFNWHRQINPDGSSQMIYVDGKVYPYDEAWEFRRIGLLQWIDPGYVINGALSRSAAIPRAKDYEKLKNDWHMQDNDRTNWWRNYLSPLVQPE